MPKNELETYCPSSQTDWRAWLEKHHASKQSVWLVYYKASTKFASLTWSEAVDEALCFGWIDSTKKTIDDERYMQYFSKRKPSSTWSKVNKDKVAELIVNNQMTKAGLACIKIAKQNGNWSLMDDVENLVLPKDLKFELIKNKNAIAFYEQQSNSIKKQILHWVVVAKRPETRKKRIDEIVQSATEGKRPKHFG